MSWYVFFLTEDMTKADLDALLVASSVDVERAFSPGRDYVSAKRHNLSHLSICRGMAVAQYAKAGWVPPGMLADGRHERAQQKLRNKKKRDAEESDSDYCSLKE